MYFTYDLFKSIINVVIIAEILSRFIINHLES